MSDKKPDLTRKRNGGRRDGPGGSSSGGGPGSRFGRGTMGWAVLLMMAVLLYVLLSNYRNRREPIDLAAFNRALAHPGVKEIIIEGNTIRGHYRPGYPPKTSAPVAPQPDGTVRPAGNDRTAGGEFVLKVHPAYITPEVLDRWAWQVGQPSPNDPTYKEKDGTVKYDDSGLQLMAIFWNMMPFAVVILLVWFLLFRQLRAGGGGGGMLSFGKTRARFLTKEHVNVTFDDVAGIQEAKEEVREIIEFLKNPKRFARLGGRIPRGVLLVGEPGCGKTLLAKAIAGEAEVPFMSICGSDFVEMFVGVGASRVRDLFKQAKENSPCIVFLDEIDAVGRRRGSGFQSGGHDEREQTLNAILVEMDGFDTNDQVIVIAATNRADVLDPALKRPGRFDRQIVIPLPDVKGRLEILRVHARNVKLAPGSDLEKLARATVGFSGAELAALINEAALAATMQSKEAITDDDLEEARDKLRMGRARKSMVVEDEDRRHTAVHEAGHALLAVLLPDAFPLHKVSIIPRGNAGGVTWSSPERDVLNMSRKRVRAEIQKLLGGRIAEEMFGIDGDTGIAGDIRMATRFARAMVCEYGMSDKLGFVHYARDGEGSGMESYIREYSEKTAQEIDVEVRTIIDDAFAAARDLLGRNRESLQRVVDGLLKYETLDRRDVENLVAGKPLDYKLREEKPAAEPPARTPEPAAAEEPPPLVGGLGGVPMPQPGT